MYKIKVFIKKIISIHIRSSFDRPHIVHIIQITYDKTKHMSDMSVKKRIDDINRVRNIIEKRDETVAILKKNEIDKLKALQLG